MGKNDGKIKLFPTFFPPSFLSAVGQQSAGGHCCKPYVALKHFLIPLKRVFHCCKRIGILDLPIFLMHFSLFSTFFSFSLSAFFITFCSALIPVNWPKKIVDGRAKINNKQSDMAPQCPKMTSNHFSGVQSKMEASVQQSHPKDNPEKPPEVSHHFLSEMWSQIPTKGHHSNAYGGSSATTVPAAHCRPPPPYGCTLSMAFIVSPP